MPQRSQPHPDSLNLVCSLLHAPQTEPEQDASPISVNKSPQFVLNICRNSNTYQ